MENRLKIKEFFDNYVETGILESNQFLKTPGGKQAIDNTMGYVIGFYNDHQDAYEEVKDNGISLYIEVVGGDSLNVNLYNDGRGFFEADIITYDHMSSNKYDHAKRQITAKLNQDKNISYRDEEYKAQVFDRLKDQGKMGQEIMAKDPKVTVLQQTIDLEGNVIASQTATLAYESDNDYRAPFYSNLTKASREASQVLGQFRGMEQEYFEGKLTIKNDLDTGDKIM